MGIMVFSVNTKKEVGMDEFLELCMDGEYVGKCGKCGHIQDGVEPDAQGYECEECGEKAVDGPLYVF